MPGFKNLREWVDADTAGQYHITQFRKAASTAATTTSAWTDYSYYAGSPVANFYASSPLEAAELESNRGIYVPSVSPAKQYLRNLKLMSAASSTTSTTNGRQQVILADILMYYPFVDTDAVGEQQDFITSITLPRYGYASVIAVGQAASSAAGQFTFSYTNQDGVAGRTSQVHNTFITAAGGQVVAASVGNAASFHPYCSLAAGDYGVKSIESVTFTVGGGGLLCFVLVRPLMTAYITQECRRDATPISFGACDEFVSIINQAPPQIIDGARLGLFACGHAGSLASSTLVGILETTWN